MSNIIKRIFLIEPGPSTSFDNESTKQSQDVDHENVSISKVCRICATVASYVVPIFEGEGLEQSLAEKINKHLPIKVSISDNLPIVLCCECTSTLLAWHELVQCSLHADSVLRARLDMLNNSGQEQPTLINPQNVTNGTDEKSERPTGLPIKVEFEVDAKPALKEEVIENPANGLVKEEVLEKPRSITVGEDGKKYGACRRCGRHVPLASWRRHARSHRPHARYSCHACGLGFNDSGNLARHVRALHARHRPHACDRCHKTFTRKSHLIDHSKSHSDERQYVCEVCGKASKSSAALRMHAKTHAACAFACVECDARFKRASELRAHVSVHTGERAHRCPCGRAFRLRTQLNAHLKTHDREPQR